METVVDPRAPMAGRSAVRAYPPGLTLLSLLAAAIVTLSKPVAPPPKPDRRGAGQLGRPAGLPKITVLQHSPKMLGKIPAARWRPATPDWSTRSPHACSSRHR